MAALETVYPYQGVETTIQSEAEWKQSIQADATKAFIAADIDHSGSIDSAEWIELSRKMRALGRDRTIEMLFHSLDADKTYVYHLLRTLTLCSLYK